MLLASAQTQPLRFDIEKNLHQHYTFVNKAASLGADLIVFPELSITGYEREKAMELSFTENDPRLETLRKLCNDHQITIIAGAPVQINKSIYIGSFLFIPDSPVLIYTKQYLHTGEEDYYQSSFNFNPLFKLHEENVALAICADIDHPMHVENACKAGATLYIPSIFFSPGGFLQHITI